MAFFVTITCWKCKEEFGLAQQTYDTLKRSQGTFHCPWGHQAAFQLGPTDEDKIRQERDKLKQNTAYLEDRLRAEKAQREAAQNQARAFKGVATRMKNRVSRGVCPCCNRTFANLQNHMASKHKGFAAEEVTVPQGALIQ